MISSYLFVVVVGVVSETPFLPLTSRVTANRVLLPLL